LTENLKVEEAKCFFSVEFSHLFLPFLFYHIYISLPERGKK